MDSYERYLKLSYFYLSIRARSEKEMRDYLIKKKASEEMIARIMASLFKHKFLNDESFARSWVASRARSRPKGKQVLKMELSQKGISREIIDQVLSEANEELPDELTQAKSIIEKRVEKLRDKPKHEIYQKVGAFLARRGFSWEITKKAIDFYLIK